MKLNKLSAQIRIICVLPASTIFWPLPRWPAFGPSSSCERDGQGQCPEVRTTIFWKGLLCFINKRRSKGITVYYWVPRTVGRCHCLLLRQQICWEGLLSFIQHCCSYRVSQNYVSTNMDWGIIYSLQNVYLVFKWDCCSLFFVFTMVNRLRLSCKSSCTDDALWLNISVLSLIRHVWGWTQLFSSVNTLDPGDCII